MKCLGMEDLRNEMPGDGGFEAMKCLGMIKIWEIKK